MAEITCIKCSKVCKSLQGWKMHQSAAHGGYNTEDIAAIAGGGNAEPDVRLRMNKLADSLPPAEGGDTTPATVAPGAEAGAPSSAAPIAERRIRATPKKLKKILGGIPAKILEEMKIELDSEDHDALDEAAEFLADVFGFEFSVPESKVVVESRWWAFVWVAGITALIYFKHRSASIFAAMKEKEEPPSGIES